MMSMTINPETDEKKTVMISRINLNGVHSTYEMVPNVLIHFARNFKKKIFVSVL